MGFNIHVSPTKALIGELSLSESWQGMAVVFISSYDKITDLPSDKYICLGFDDVGSTTDGGAITENDAERIKNFVLGLGEDTEDLFFCCDRGESRSAALASLS